MNKIALSQYIPVNVWQTFCGKNSATLDDHHCIMEVACPCKTPRKVA